MNCPVCHQPCLKEERPTVTLYICLTHTCINEGKEVGRE